MDRYDLCVLGGGPSGYAAAMRAVDFGKKVLLIEKTSSAALEFTTVHFLQKPSGKFPRNMNLFIGK